MRGGCAVRHARARREERAHLRVHREVGVALAGPLLAVGEAGVAHRAARPPTSSLPNGSGRSDLASSVDRVHPHRDLAGAGAEERTVHADHVAEVELRELRERRRRRARPSEVELDAPVSVREMREDRLAVAAPRDDAPGHAAPHAVPRSRRRAQQRHGARRAVPCVALVAVGEGRAPPAAARERVELLAPRACIT